MALRQDPRDLRRAVRRDFAPGVLGGIPPIRLGMAPANPFQTFYEGFKSSAEQFRRAKKFIRQGVFST